MSVRHTLAASAVLPPTAGDLLYRPNLPREGEGGELGAWSLELYIVERELFSPKPKDIQTCQNVQKAFVGLEE
jgi:hypothetical protein